MGLKGYQEPWGQCGKENSREASRGPDESHQPDGKSHLGQGAVLPSVLLRAEVGALGSPMIGIHLEIRDPEMNGIQMSLFLWTV